MYSEVRGRLPTFSHLEAAYRSLRMWPFLRRVTSCQLRQATPTKLYPCERGQRRKATVDVGYWRMRPLAPLEVLFLTGRSSCWQCRKSPPAQTIPANHVSWPSQK